MLTIQSQISALALMYFSKLGMGAYSRVGTYSREALI